MSIQDNIWGVIFGWNFFFNFNSQNISKRVENSLNYDLQYPSLTLKLDFRGKMLQKCAHGPFKKDSKCFSKKG